MSGKLLVAGASGLVGFAALRHFMGLPGWEVAGLSRRVPAGLEQARILSLDLLDRGRCAEVLGSMREVTHVVYAALYEKPGLIPGWRDPQQMRTNLAMLENFFEPLEAASPLEHVTLLQGTKAYGSHLGPVPVPARERWPRHPHENFYWLQEDYLRAKQQGKRWQWTILRPQVIFGESWGRPQVIVAAFALIPNAVTTVDMPPPVRGPCRRSCSEHRSRHRHPRRDGCRRGRHRTECRQGRCRQ